MIVQVFEAFFIFQQANFTIFFLIFSALVNLSSFHTHKTFIVFSSFSRIFIFELWVIETGAESYRRWLIEDFVGDKIIGSPTSSFNSTAGFLTFIVSDCDSSEDVADVLMEIIVECKGNPISWKEFMLEKPLSSSVWWQVENLFDFVGPFEGMLIVLLVLAIGKIVDSSSSLFEFDELEDEWTDDSSVLRNDKCDSRSKAKRNSVRCVSNVRCWKLIASDVPLACERIGSCVLRKFCTVLDKRKASFESFSASISFSWFTFDRVSKMLGLLSSGWKENFSGLISLPLVDFVFGDRRL